MVVTRWRTGVRFGIGDPNGHRSSSWTVKGGRDSSICVLSRDVGHVIKRRRIRATSIGQVAGGVSPWWTTARA